MTAANGKELMMLVIDGDTRTPLTIAQELGFVGDAISDQDVLRAVQTVLAQSQDIVLKIQKTGKTGPVMALVGKVMQLLNKRGDPV